MKKVELLVEVFDFENLKVLLETEVDSVLIGENLSKFNLEQIKKSVELAKDKNKKIYLSFNKIPHEKDIFDIKNFLEKIKDLSVDGIYVIEPGLLQVVKQVLKNVNVFFSEQANVTNYETANFWFDEGIKRFVVSKELSIKDITEITSSINSDLEVEMLVHGSLLISYSGRKLLSNFLKDKTKSDDFSLDYKYNLVEDQRPGMYFPVYEDERGTFLFNTEDLCMIEYIPEIINSNVKVLRIDTRLKNADYTVEVIKSYKKAIDEFYKNLNEWKFDENWIKNMRDLSIRKYTTGFYVKNKQQGENL